ncbi:MAG: hypothetical protein M2R45_02165 [Verrucomicrobia subdivision 3 bacterium]|nr:hypothetical protein [Limisphaerales bacterium]
MAQFLSSYFLKMSVGISGSRDRIVRTLLIDHKHKRFNNSKCLLFLGYY